MAVYKCSICGFIHDEDKEQKTFSQVKVCPICKHDVSVFERIHVDNKENGIKFSKAKISGRVKKS